jgi:lipopolysaccharide transport protein LptA/LPS export ABC transporter protein LptC
MPEKQTRKNTKNLQLRAKMPLIARVLAIFALVGVIVAIGIGFYQAYGYKQFRMKGFPTELSEDVVAEVSGYERTETEGDVKKYYIKADKATTFADNHQEMENIYLQLFDEKGEKFDTITASKAVYVPKKDGTKNFTAYLAGEVNVATRDGLQIKTEQVTYTKETETVEAEETVEFSRENVSGKAFGALVKIKEKTLELLKDVEINAFGNSEEFSQIQSARITAGRALVNQLEEKIELNQDVFVSVTPNAGAGEMAQPSDIKTDKATVLFKEREIKQIDLNGNVYVYQKPTDKTPRWSKVHANRASVQINKEVKRLELFENVDIETTQNDSKPTRIKTNYALYEKDADRFELKNGVEIVTVEDNQPTRINASEAIYEQSNGRIYLNGNAEIVQGDNFIKGDKLTAELYPNKKLKTAHAFDNAFLRQTTPERTTEVSSNQLNATFNDSQQLQTANAIGASRAVLTPSQANDEYTRVSLSAPNAIRLNFQGAGLLQQMQTEGRTTILLNAPNNRADAANKKLTADTVKTVFSANGKDLSRAEAVGNAELYVEPLRASGENYKTTINAPRFDCDFFETGNNARSCAAGTKAKVVRVPTVPTNNRGNQTLVADRLNAAFNQATQDIEQMEAVGNTKFSELDRNGIAEKITFTNSDKIVRLRGGEPTVWDSRARAKANEIDWDTGNDKSVLRGKVSTTYYSQNQTGGATPFGDLKSPVFLTADEANFDHKAEKAVYSGNARAWQENNYVRADRLQLSQKEGTLYGEGTVQSVLYDAKQNVGGKRSDVPVYVSSNKIFYSKENRLLRYEGDVDIRQGTDRITAGIANVYLKNNNELSQTVAENNVVVTQPNRRATGDWAQYTADNETVVLRGNPARVEDAENGSSQSAQITVNMRTKNVVSEAKTPQTNTGRIRSVYKVKKP